MYCTLYQHSFQTFCFSILDVGNRNVNRFSEFCVKPHLAPEILKLEPRATRREEAEWLMQLGDQLNESENC